jgi:hypothetical protein
MHRKICKKAQFVVFHEVLMALLQDISLTNSAPHNIFPLNTSPKSFDTIIIIVPISITYKIKSVFTLPHHILKIL